VEGIEEEESLNLEAEDLLAICTYIGYKSKRIRKY
jgi:hypothetical protein